MRDNLFSDLNIQLGAHCPLPIVSTNGYYGYQPVRNQPDNKADEHHNQMEVDSNSFSENANITDSNSNAQLFNRKRLSSEPIEVHAFKKRRQNGIFQAAESSKPKFGRKPTHNLPDLPRSVFNHF
ncbi:uncharacterized protein LOC123309065 isoform X2 [Coccinella septempunctata]|uniref:uncharacterized protein LOC123309065 isoform X2 n=1 Tax=Coccinella septempunctata TaxID=41139 RepID=UPI001D088E64|nr:uncharacterized protein LOC123309065 isoform X2 [Coccinella septempunctata]